MSVESHKTRFNFDKPTDREARDALQAVPAGQRNQFILNAICEYGEQTAEEERQERFAQQVAVIVMDGLSDTSIYTVPRGCKHERAGCRCAGKELGHGRGLPRQLGLMVAQPL